MTLFDCPACEARVETEPVDLDDPEQVCGAEFPDRSRTRCWLRPHAADEHDPEHAGRNPDTGAVVSWRASEHGP